MAQISDSLTVSNQPSYTEFHNFSWFTTVGLTLWSTAGKMLTQQSHTINSLLLPLTTTTGASKACSSTLIAATFTLLMELLSIKSAFFIMTKPSSSIKYPFLSKFILLFLSIKKNGSWLFSLPTILSFFLMLPIPPNTEKSRLSSPCLFSFNKILQLHQTRTHFQGQLHFFMLRLIKMRKSTGLNVPVVSGWVWDCVLIFLMRQYNKTKNSKSLSLFLER